MCVRIERPQGHIEMVSPPPPPSRARASAVSAAAAFHGYGLGRISLSLCVLLDTPGGLGGECGERESRVITPGRQWGVAWPDSPFARVCTTH